MSYKLMNAFFNSKCSVCAEVICKNASFYYDKSADRGKKALCLACYANGKQPAASTPIPPFASKPNYMPPAAKPAKPKKTPRVHERELTLSDAIQVFEESLQDTRGLSLDRNRTVAEFCHASDQDRFRGASISEVKDMLRGNTAAPDCSSPPSQVTDLLTPILGGVIRRVRERRDDFGECREPEHRESDRPFTRRRKKRAPMPIIEIDAHLSANCMTGAEEITRAGQFLYAVVRYLESCGVLCGINMTSGSDNYTSDCEHDYRIKIRLKNPGEYLDPNVLSGVLSSSFYRSVIFANEIKIADDNGLLVSMGLGQAWSPETGAKPGQITLSLGNITDPDTQIREFIKALGAA